MVCYVVNELHKLLVVDTLVRFDGSVFECLELWSVMYWSSKSPIYLKTQSKVLISCLILFCSAIAIK